MSKIKWCDKTWNPITGCTPISEGCQNCYAKRMATRLKGRFGYPADDPFKVTFHSDKLTQAISWRKPRKIFVCSMGDLFHEDLHPEYARRVVMYSRMLSRHTFVFLTKRPQNIIKKLSPKGKQPIKFSDNSWLGVSAENQKRADERIPTLLQIPAAKRFVSLEPLLGYVNLDEYVWKITHIDKYRIDWVIVGCESGPRRRPAKIEWVEEIVKQCQMADVPVFVKQAEIDGKIVKMPKILGRVWDQFPE